MDYQVIQDLIKIMDKAKLSKLSVKEKNGFEVCLERESDGHHAPKHQLHSAPHHATPQAEKSVEKSSSAHFIKSPMVGTFYAAASPNDPPFAKVGERVEKGQVVCIIEAMKVMNEVKADKAGTVKEVLVENMQPVEFGTKLFGLE